MFTGLVEEAGRVVAIRADEVGARLEIEASLVDDGARPGDSICVNGVCLTVVEIANGRRLVFEAVPETLRRSNLSALRVGDRVNLERALAVGDRLGGHIVQGHVDGVGQIAAMEPEGNATRLTVQAPEALMCYIVEKGSIALDGISLTVAAVGNGAFSVAVIPHTWEVTNLRDRQVGDIVNLEVDLLAKYVERLLSGRR